jgi:hypothetical protein
MRTAVESDLSYSRDEDRLYSSTLFLIRRPYSSHPVLNMKNIYSSYPILCNYEDYTFPSLFPI